MAKKRQKPQNGPKPPQMFTRSKKESVLTHNGHHESLEKITLRGPNRLNGPNPYCFEIGYSNQNMWVDRSRVGKSGKNHISTVRLTVKTQV